MLAQYKLFHYNWNQKFCFFSEVFLYATLLRVVYLWNLYCYVFLNLLSLETSTYIYIQESKILGWYAF